MRTEQMDAVDAMRSEPPTAAVVQQPAVAGGVTDLVLRDDQTMWDEKQLYALKNSLGVEDAPNEDLAIFFHQAKRTRLDPFSKQIYLIGRWDGRAQKKKWTIQTSIDGFRIYRDRIGGFAGQKEQWCGPDGIWRDVWLSKEYPAAARVLVWKEGWTEPVQGIALWEEFAPYKDNKPQAMWARMPALMLSKCAEALGLRKAFPHDLSGLYVTEEMAQAEPDVVTLRAAPARASAPASQPNQGQPAPSAQQPAPAGQAGTQGAASEPARPTGSTGAPAGSGDAATGRGEPPADVVANWRRHVLSREYKGSQTSRDGGMRTAFQEVRKAGLLDYPIEPNGPTFRQKMVELSASLPDQPNEAGDVPTTQAGDARPGWPTDDSGWAVPPEDQPL